MMLLSDPTESSRIGSTRSISAKCKNSWREFSVRWVTRPLFPSMVLIEA